MQQNLPSPSAQVAVRLLAVPDQMPPYDDAVTEHAAAAQAVRPVTVRPARAAATSPPPEVTPDRPPGPPSRQQPAGWPGQFAQVLAETLAGSRPAEQLTPWTTERARRQIRQLGPQHATGQRPRVRKIMTSAPSRDAVELTAVVGFGPRTRVLAFRLERADAHLSTSKRRGWAPRRDRREWLCTAIESA